MNKCSFDLSLYVVLDYESLNGKNIMQAAAELTAGGATMIQYRDKISTGRVFFQQALKLREVTRKMNIPLVINDRFDIALAVQADGVHLGQDDLPIAAVRSLAGEKLFIGSSISNWQEFDNIDGADYLGVGALFATNTKVDAEYSGLKFLEKVREKSRLPLVGIGGINIERIDVVLNSGADGVAVVSALLQAEDITLQTRKMKDRIDAFRKKYPTGH